MDTLRSSIRPAILKTYLLRGSGYAAAGGLAMLLCGTYLDLSSLGQWGKGIFLLGSVLIAFGFLPYKRLSYLELHPSQISFFETHWELGMHCLGTAGWNSWKPAQKALVRIPTSSIRQIRYIEGKKIYGIGLELDLLAQEKIRIYTPSFNMQRYVNRCRKTYGCDLFVPYFTERAFLKARSALGHEA